MEEMEKYLVEWDLADLVPIFNDNSIDLQSFKLLQESDIRNLIPKLGPRLKLIQRWREYLINTSEFLLSTPISSSGNCTPDLSTPSTSSVQLRTPLSSDDISCNSTATSARQCEISFTTPSLTPPSYEESESKNELFELLNSCNAGKEIIAHYKVFGVLKRRFLVTFIIAHELKDDSDKRISRETFQRYSRQICEIFPEESEHTYYIPARRDHNGKPISAHGKLWDKYMNTRGKFRRLQLIPQKRKETRNKENTAETFPRSADIFEKQSFLQHNNQPWTTITEYWTETCDARKDDYEKSEISIHQYFDTYPALRMPQGHSLLCIDFKHRFPDKDHKLFVEWPKIYRSIVNIAKRKKCPIINRLLFAFEDKKQNLENGEQQVFDQNISLLLFPLLFPNTSRQKKNSPIRKFSKIEIAESFITHVEQEADLNVIFEQREARSRLLKSTEQPSVFIIGELQHPKAILKINTVIYELETPLKAVDTCFKSFFALNAKFPSEAEQVWTYIQNVIFEIYTDSDCKFNAVTSLHSDLLQDINQLSSNRPDHDLQNL